jgi:hypothetical protein
MTYPPQQPGPGGWEQQPAGNGFPPPMSQGNQQQPNWYGNQHAGMPQQGPEQPVQGQPFPGQPPQAGPPAQPPQWGNWIPEANGFADVQPEKPKSKTPLMLGLVGALLVLALGGGGLFWWLSSNDPGAARPVAQEVVAKVNAGDFNGVGQLFCEANRGQLDRALEQLEQYKFDVRLGKVTEQGDRASAHLSGSYLAAGSEQPVDQTMGLTVENGEWKVCALDQ